ncbi:MAG TPA: KinB-signaling pathway activation protein [Virgibacillus sp.]|nr:KinB-signaling pathway activation protein [Virgibacillus sp.]
MNTRKWVGMFFKTLIIGGVVGLITSFFVETDDYMTYMQPFDLWNLFGLVLFFVGIGLVFSVVSQTGFFAYLFINQFGLGMFRSFWPKVQLLLIAFVLFDLVYFPFKEAEGETPLYLFVLMSAGLLVYGLFISWIKADQTKRRAFVPALFLMIVMTTVEWVPGLRASGSMYAWLSITTLLACNTYQLLILHKLTNSPSAKEHDAKEAGAGTGKNPASKKA